MNRTLSLIALTSGVLFAASVACAQVVTGTFSNKFGSQPVGGTARAQSLPARMSTAPFGYYNPYGPNTPFGFVVYNTFAGYPGYSGYRYSAPLTPRQLVAAPVRPARVLPKIRRKPLVPQPR
jgi:hypothetical protein